MGFDLAGMIKEKIEELNHVGEKVAPKLEQMFNVAIGTSLDDFYGSYSPKQYERTGNLSGIASSSMVLGEGNTLVFFADSSYMHDYPGIYKPLSASTGFDFMFMNGEHGHGRFHAADSFPPYDYVDRVIASKFGGQATRIIEETVGEILRS